MQCSEIEAELAKLLGGMFQPDELYRFLRHRVGSELTDALPVAEYLGRADYAAQAATKLVDRKLLNAKFFAALAEVRSGWIDEIHKLAHRLGVSGKWQRTASTPRYRNADSQELSEKLEQAKACRSRLEKAGVAEPDVIAVGLIGCLGHCLGQSPDRRIRPGQDRDKTPAEPTLVTPRRLAFRRHEPCNRPPLPSGSTIRRLLGWRRGQGRGSAMKSRISIGE